MEPHADQGWIRWVILGLGLSVVWVAYLALFGPSIDSIDRLDPPTLVGTGSPVPVEYAWSVRDLADAPVAFDRFRGKTVVLNLWATWCAPCRAEMPSLALLANDPAIKARGIEVVCLATDESPEALRQYLAKKDWPMTFLRATALPGALMADGLPATFVLTADGRVAATQLGSARWDDPTVVAFLTKLAAPSP